MQAPKWGEPPVIQVFNRESASGAAFNKALGALRLHGDFRNFGYSSPNDSEGILDRISCGAHLVVFTTGRGSVIGSVISPVLKVCGNPKTYARMREDMDVNTGRIIAGEASVSDLGMEIFKLIQEAVATRLTGAELLGHREYCIPYKAQDMCANAKSAGLNWRASPTLCAVLASLPP